MIPLHNFSNPSESGFLPGLALTPTSALLLDRHQSYQDTGSLTRLLKASGNKRPAWGLGLLTPALSFFPPALGSWTMLHSMFGKFQRGSVWGSHTTQAPCMTWSLFP